MCPWTCDAILPAGQRHASLKFGRAVAGQLDYFDACELAAFERTVGFGACRWIFGWASMRQHYIREILAHLKEDQNVERMWRENVQGLDRDAAVAVVDAMHDGGWRGGHLRPELMMGLAELGRPAVRKRYGMTATVAETATGYRRPSQARRGRKNGGFRSFFGE